MFYYAGKILKCFFNDNNQCEKLNNIDITLTLYGILFPISFFKEQSSEGVAYKTLLTNYKSTFSSYQYKKENDKIKVKACQQMKRLYLTDNNKLKDMKKNEKMEIQYKVYESTIVNEAFESILREQNSKHLINSYAYFKEYLNNFKLEKLFNNLLTVIKNEECPLLEEDAPFIINSVDNSENICFNTITCSELINKKINLKKEEVNKEWIIYTCWIYAMSWYISGEKLYEFEKNTIGRVSHYIFDHLSMNPYLMIAPAFLKLDKISEKELIKNGFFVPYNFYFCLGKFIGEKIVMNDIYNNISVENNIGFTEDKDGKYKFGYQALDKNKNQSIDITTLIYEKNDKDKIKILNSIYDFFEEIISFIITTRSEHMKPILLDLSKNTSYKEFIYNHNEFFGDLSYFKAGLLSGGGYLANILFKGLCSKDIMSAIYWQTISEKAKNRFSDGINKRILIEIEKRHKEIINWKKWTEWEIKSWDPCFDYNPFAYYDPFDIDYHGLFSNKIADKLYEHGYNYIAYGAHKYWLYMSLNHNFSGLFNESPNCKLPEYLKSSMFSIPASTLNAIKATRNELGDDLCYVDEIIDRNIHRSYFELQWILDDLESFRSLLKTSDYADKNTFGNNENIEYNEKALNGTPYEGAIKAALNTYSENTGFTMKLVVSDNKLQIYGAQNDFNNVRFITNLVIELEMIEDYQFELVYENDNDNNNEFKYLFTIKIMNSN